MINSEWRPRNWLREGKRDNLTVFAGSIQVSEFLSSTLLKDVVIGKIAQVDLARLLLVEQVADEGRACINFARFNRQNGGRVRTGVNRHHVGVWVEADCLDDGCRHQVTGGRGRVNEGECVTLEVSDGLDVRAIALLGDDRAQVEGLDVRVKSLSVASIRRVNAEWLRIGFLSGQDVSKWADFDGVDTASLHRLNDGGVGCASVNDNTHTRLNFLKFFFEAGTPGLRRGKCLSDVVPIKYPLNECIRPAN